MIARKSALILSIEATNGILGYFAIFLVARYMAMPDYALGVVSFAYGLVSIYNMFANLGFQNAHVKRVSEGQDFETCMGTFAAIKVALHQYVESWRLASEILCHAPRRVWPILVGCTIAPASIVLRNRSFR